MEKLKNLISNIFNFGINEALSEKKKKRVRITNILAFAVVILITPLAFLFHIIGADSLRTTMMIAIVYQFIILILNKKGFINFSRFIAPNLNALTIFISSTTLGPATLCFFFYFPGISGSFLYFELKEKKFFAFSMIFSSILIYLDLFLKLKPLPSVYLSPGSTVLTSYFMLGGAFLLFLICLFALAAESQVAEASLIKSRKKAESATMAKSDFLARMSHEIRTPMNAVIGLTHLVLGTELSIKQQDYLKKIQSSSQALLRIINDILDFSKIEAGKLAVESTKFNLQTVLDNIYSTISLKASEKGMEILFVLDEKVPDLLKGDPVRLGQVLINLTDNAVKFSSRGSVVISTELIEKNQDSIRIKFSVRDEGIGMTSEQISSLFKSFHQVDGSITRRFGGTGLGLAISKQLVELMGGRLDVESTSGKGTLFFFEISFKLGANINGLETKGDYLETLHGAKLLIVEDNPLNQQVISELIEQMGLEYDLAVNGREGLQMACKNPYDLVLMDIQMPEMDGLTATQQIRTYGLKDLPIIAMTAHAMKSDKERSLQAGMNDHLTKPIDPDELSQMLLKFIQPNGNNGKTNQMSTEKAKKNFKYILPDIDGLDVKKGLERLRGSEKLYIKLLGEYTKLYKDVGKTIRRMVENDEIGKAMHLVHSLKGASSTMGMHNISIIATTIEQYLMDGNAVKALENLSDKEHFLAKIIKDIENYFLAVETPMLKEPEPDQRESVDLFQITRLIRTFIELCKNRDSEALDVAEQLQPMFFEKKNRDIVSEILGLVEDVEFSEAAELAGKILTDIEE